MQARPNEPDGDFLPALAMRRAPAAFINVYTALTLRRLAARNRLGFIGFGGR